MLGGGLVLGSVTLLGGDPGIGKSTMLLQAGDALSRATPTLYVTGEESLRQVSLRARRLGVGGRHAAAARGDVGRHDHRARARSRRARAGHRLHPDHVRDRGGVLARIGRAGARVGRGAGALREIVRRVGADHRPRHEGRRDRRPAHPRAHGRHGAVLRERCRQSLPPGARGQESLRRRQRSRRVRHDRAGPQGSEEPVGDFPLAARAARQPAAQ